MTDDWDWEFTPRAEAEFESLDPSAQRQLLAKLDEVITESFALHRNT